MTNLLDIPVELPTIEEIQQGNRFRAYLNYLSALSSFLGDVEADPGTLLKPVVESLPFQRIKRKQNIDRQQLGRSLRNAWFTEVQLNIPSEFPDFLSYSIHWAPIQSYYATYHVLRSYYLASNRDVGRAHATTLKTIGEVIHQRPQLFPYPWRVYCTGNPEVSLPQLVNLPAGTSISKISPLSLSHNVSSWDSFAMFLKTTRQRQLDVDVEEWKRKQKAKRLRPGVKQALVASLPRATTLFDCLYRLRIRSNYVDADSFLLGVYESEDASDFHKALTRICWSTLLILEILIARHVGKQAFGTIVTEFLKHEKKGWSKKLIALRWESIKASM